MNQDIERIFTRQPARLLSTLEAKGLLTPALRSMVLRSFRYTASDVQGVVGKIGNERSGNGNGNDHQQGG